MQEGSLFPKGLSTKSEWQENYVTMCSLKPSRWIWGLYLRGIGIGIGESPSLRTNGLFIPE
jgi:hypothetical protein